MSSGFGGLKQKKNKFRVPSYVDGTQGILIFLGIFWELKPTFALFKEKIPKYLLYLSLPLLGVFAKNSKVDGSNKLHYAN